MSRPGGTVSVRHATSSSLAEASSSNSLPPPSSDQDETCPVCKTTRYFNRDMEFRINPECYHRMCKTCVERIFKDGPNQCPYAGCHKTLRLRGFKAAFFGDLGVEREVDIRRRVAHVFNKVEDDFETLRDYNDYLDMVECLTDDLVNGPADARAKAAEALKVLLDQGMVVQGPEHFAKVNGEVNVRPRPQPSLDPQQELFLTRFYERSALKLFQPLVDLEDRTDMNLTVQQASMFTYLVDILCFFIRQHHRFSSTGSNGVGFAWAWITHLFRRRTEKRLVMTGIVCHQSSSQKRKKKKKWCDEDMWDSTSSSTPPEMAPFRPPGAVFEFPNNASLS
ncbi:kinase [Ophiocordyceps sinensis CO18]|uniref:Kinase n=1 Tax=Ophiocordyceps sinensis (strain Co18 / CGMCC 3.14243) TaxID=911162 RepID=T5AKN9_OPHSC|nr:kinase [Ophiocordyceps sinensis CO18]